MTEFREETDSLGIVRVPADKLWGAQTQRSLEHFSIGKDLIPREMITAYATLKKAAANANHAGGRLNDRAHGLILQVCDEILTGQHHDMFPLHVWMVGSGTQFNMNVNEVVSNRCCQLAGTALGSKSPVHPNDDVNMSQSSNDSFPSAMHIAAAVNVTERLSPAVAALRDGIAAKAEEWKDIVKIGRTHTQDAMPITLGREWSGYAGMLGDNVDRIEQALKDVCRLALGGTAGGRRNQRGARLRRGGGGGDREAEGLPFVTAPNKFTVQGAHDALAQLSGVFRTLAVSLYKICNDIRLMSCGPRAGFAELKIPENEPGSSIMPGKANPTQAEALTMIAVQFMANDVAVGFGGASGYLEMNVYKPLIIFNITHSITIMTDGCTNFRKFLIEGTQPNLPKIKEYVDRSLMLVTALAPVIGYDKASKIAHHAIDKNLTLKAAALELGFVNEQEFRPCRRSDEDGQAICRERGITTTGVISDGGELGAGRTRVRRGRGCLFLARTSSTRMLLSRTLLEEEQTHSARVQTREGDPQAGVLCASRGLHMPLESAAPQSGVTTSRLRNQRMLSQRFAPALTRQVRQVERGSTRPTLRRYRHGKRAIAGACEMSHHRASKARTIPSTITEGHYHATNIFACADQDFMRLGRNGAACRLRRLPYEFSDQ